ncbi:MAG: ABC transporter substrate-binding protein [Gammaproteobacteria bacterium HGW-Gammaproteobacteria-10]|nr:MAG: ABC transporter substrate-binding protein [Gammaproteobacteria bacterium HGW-Gammaproteobacteria-10]
MNKWPLLTLFLLGLLLTGCTPEQTPDKALADLTWPQIEQRARSQTVQLRMWRGNPNINRYMDGYVTVALKQHYGIDLRISSGQGNDLVAQLMAEIEAGSQTSQVDMMWINGETFYQLRRIDALYGPFTGRLPNIAAVDLDNPFINTDFQQPVAGFEIPWGNVQLAHIYDAARTPEPPRTLDALAAWVKAHPGRFTFDTGFTGMTFLKGLLYALAEQPQALHGAFDEAVYQRLSAKLWAYLHGLQPYLWRQGQTFPSSVAELQQLFVNGEVDFSMSNNDAEVELQIRNGVFPATARAYVFDSGSIQNSHYLGITRHSGHLAAALVVGNFLLSPEAQLEKMKLEVWGDGTILDINRLPEQWRKQFLALPTREHAPPRAELQAKALLEPAPEYMIRLFEDFRREMLQ